jgi:hypothetical protein
MRPRNIVLMSAINRGTDSQSVTTGAVGVNPNRQRGFFSSTGTGAVVDGTSNLYSGAAITQLGYDEGGGSPFYTFSITGNFANNGWNQLVIDGSKTLLRSAAGFISGGGSSTWTWTTADTVAAQIFGAATSVHTCVFS